MIRYLRGEEKNLSRGLWEEAFREDSASFTDYYFEQVLRTNRILADVEHSQLRSMIHFNPYELWVRNRIWRAEYLVGVATRAELRRQGCMRRLLLRGLRDLYAEKMPFCFLMPADESVYRPFGFTYIARKPRRELADAVPLRRYPLLLGQRDEACPQSRTERDRTYLGEASEWLNRWLEGRYEVFALRTEDYLLRLLKELASENGSFDILYDGGAVVGMESVWGLEEREQRFLYGDVPYVRELPASEPAIMGRILDLREFVRVIGLRENVETEELVIPLSVDDKLLPENRGDWLWHLKRGASWLERAAERGGELGQESGCGKGAGAGKWLELGIDELAAWLFGYHVPPAAREYDGSVDTLRGVLLDEEV